ncbi:capsular polysaccharide synthesis protein [Flavobacteriales bacterium]|nr:capsular polysaccharide synthesis protein [Flavobacteriales bacterium]
MARPIFLYWHQGWDDAPELVKECAQSWIRFHGDEQWSVHLLDKNNVHGWLEECHSEDTEGLLRFLVRFESGENVGGLNNYANLLRLVLLDHFGGIWTDATTLCFQPLDSWLPAPTNLGMPRSLAAERRTETWLIDNRCGDPALSAWKKRYRDLYFSNGNRITYLDNWGIPRYKPTYWMVNFAMRSKGLAMRIWNGNLALKILKVRPYFATNHMLEYVLRYEVPIERASRLHHLILPIDAELHWEVHISDWSQPMTPFMKKRIEHAPLIKLNHKAQWVERANQGKLNPNSAWNHWIAKAKGLKTE